MRKLFWVVAVIAAAGLIGCGNAEKKNDTKEATQTEASSQESNIQEGNTQESNTKESNTRESDTQGKNIQGNNTQEGNTQENKEHEQQTVSLSDIDPYAAKEIQNILDDINKNIVVNDKAGSANVIKQATGIMGLAAGNSLAEEQVKLVINDWKQKNSHSIVEFRKKMKTVYEEYEKLNSGAAEEELKKAGLTLNEHEYCGNGKLDMVEWIYRYVNE